MQKILSRLFHVLKFVMLAIGFLVVFYGILVTYKRLNKNLLSALPVIMPFVVLLIMFVINGFSKKYSLKDNLLYNFTCFIVLLAVIIVGVRAKIDTNMILYYKYKIDYNPLYLSDNLSTIRVLLYGLSIATVFYMLPGLVDGKKKKVAIDEEEKEK